MSHSCACLCCVENPVNFNVKMFSNPITFLQPKHGLTSFAHLSPLKNDWLTFFVYLLSKSWLLPITVCSSAFFPLTTTTQLLKLTFKNHWYTQIAIVTCHAWLHTTLTDRIDVMWVATSQLSMSHT